MMNEHWKQNENLCRMIMIYSNREIYSNWCRNMIGQIGYNWDYRLITNHTGVLFSEYVFKNSGDGLMFKLSFIEDCNISKLSFDKSI